MWLGPAQQVPYIQKRVHPVRDLKGRPGWMRSTLFCDGMLTNWGAHLNDIAQWGNGTERTGPVEVKATGKFHQDKVWDVLESFGAWYRFANGVEMFYEMGEPHVRFEGDKGWIQVNYFKTAEHPELEASDPKILREQIGPGELRFPLRSERVDFIEAVKAPRPDAGGRRGRAAHDLASATSRTSSIQRGGAKLKWDPVKEQFPDDPEANKLLTRPAARAPWGTE